MTKSTSEGRREAPFVVAHRHEIRTDPTRACVILSLVADALLAAGLRKTYRATVALDGVDLRVRAGELVGLLGPNGAGKSTLTKIACGLVRPTAGQVTVLGHPAGSTAARARTGYLAELFRFPGWASADEVLELHQRLARSGGGAAERTELLALVGLTEAARRRVEAMSKGMQQRLGIAQALVGAPSLVLLDEPTSALDPAGRRTVRELLEGLRGRGVAVLLNSHLLSEVELVCDRVVIVDGGRTIAEGAPHELAAAGGVEIDTAAGLKRFPDAGREQVPALVTRLVRQGEEIYGVRVVTGTLEDAYLRLVGKDAR
ncbi:MAG TPA: ABC transporter ATP-binding protein [Solirubrobacteraceae bacterium]|nr:ABC transporter ATP-binding protein [Solirubrobacteraceae bacterium]